MHLLPAQGRHGQPQIDRGPAGGVLLVRGGHGLAFPGLGRSRILAAFGQGQIFVQLQLAQAQGAFHGEHVPEVQAQFRPQVKEHFPELTVYTSFNPPRWLCRAGDFRSIEEADAMMRQLRATGVFKEVSIVKEQINIPL